jgi:hypothetical protein
MTQRKSSDPTFSGVAPWDESALTRRDVLDAEGRIGVGYSEG